MKGDSVESTLEKSVFLNESFSTQEEAFKFLANTVVKNGYADDAAAVDSALHKREEEGTTGMMDGFAIPHAKSKSISQANIVIVKLTRSIEWEAMDEKPIDFIVALFIPEEEKGTVHLTVLSKVARMLMRETVRDQLRQAQTEDQIDTILNDYIFN